MLTAHIILGIGCLVTGLIAMIAAKRKGVHTRFGEIYHALYVGIAVTAIILSLLRWSKDAYLFYIAIFSYGNAFLGYRAKKRRANNWLTSHIAGMIGSYIGAVTALMVNVVPLIPVWNTLYPPLINWFLPTIIGTPIIFHLVNKHVKSKLRSAPANVKRSGPGME